jgi:GMP synthase (glutamine-hydrolysing)
MRPLVLIVDFGSQYTQLIARRTRELSVYSEIVSCLTPAEELRAKKPVAIILSGGPSSVYDPGAPKLPEGLLELGVPVLGICYGAQLLAHALGGKVERSQSREYGAARLLIDGAVGPLSRFAQGEHLDVWMSHGDRITALPEGFAPIGSSEHSPFCAIADVKKGLYGVQFHPEVVHTKRGSDILAAFLFDVAKLEPTWVPLAFVEESIETIKKQVPGNERAVCGLSGGVDSSVAAVLVHKAIGDRLTCIFVDNGLLRKGEREEVEDTFKRNMKIDLRVVDARERFMKALEGLTDPEAKRKAIGRVFIEVFEVEAKSIDGANHLVQGTLYPDVIESVSFKGPSAVIKSHHNVGGLPERMRMKLVEPLRELFKDEVRAAGRTLGMAHELLGRQPFPGPGLAIRCLGHVTEARLHVLREADAIVMDEIRKANLYDVIWQSFCVLLPVRSVGVMGDDRTYEETCAVRAVTSLDGMTAAVFEMPYEVLNRISTRIINEVRGINRVVYDVSSKPPATIEWE